MLIFHLSFKYSVIATKTEILQDFLPIHAHPPNFAKIGMGIDEHGWGCPPPN